MPFLYTAIPEVWNTITRPVAIGVAKQVAALLEIPKDTRIVVPGTTETIPMAGSTVDDPNIQNYFKYDGRLTIEIRDDYNEDPSYTRNVLKRGNPIAFKDEKIDFYINTIYTGNKLVLDMTYRAPNRTTALRFRDEARMRTAMDRTCNLHEIRYSYGFPREILKLMHSLYTLREANAGYGESFEEWINRGIDPRTTQVVTLAGTESEIVIPETQVGLVGWFDFAEQPEPADRENEGGTWVLKFQYTLEYERVMAMSAEFPLVIHNQLVDEQYYHTPELHGPQYAPHYSVKYSTEGRYALSQFTPEVHSQLCHHWEALTHIPAMDDWVPHYTRSDTVGVLSVLLVIDPEHPTDLVDLSELGEWQIEPGVLDFIRSEGDNVFHAGESAVLIEVYENESRIAPDDLQIDGVHITARNPMEQRKTYHMRLSFYSDYVTMRPDAIKRLGKSGEVGLTILSHVQYRTLGRVREPELILGKFIPSDWIKGIGKEILEHQHLLPWPNGVGNPYEGHYTIVSRSYNAPVTEYIDKTRLDPNLIRKQEEKPNARDAIETAIGTATHRQDDTEGRKETPVDHEYARPRCNG